MSAQPRPDRERGVFETLLVLEGRPVELKAHIDRLRASLAALFPGRRMPEGLVALVEGAASNIVRGALRLLVAPAGERGFLARTEVVEIEKGLILPSSPPAARCKSLELRGGLGAHKWADRRVVEQAEAELGPGTLPLFVDADGGVLETSRANVFAVVGRTLLTPPTDGRILPGISRARALRLASSVGLEPREATLPAERLAEADEIFLTSSVRGVERVEAIDGIPLAGEGEATARIASAMRQAWSHGGLDRVPRR